MKIVVTSREMVKPSKPTPSHLHHYQLSFLDQMNGQIFAPMIYFYPSSSHAMTGVRVSNLDKSDKVKKSLSETLTEFYPLAGRLRKCRYICCTDEGVEFLEAQVNCLLSQVVDQYNLATFNYLLPSHALQNAGDVPMAIQINFFDCGGMVIAMCFNHKIMDALSIITFVNFWASISRGDCGNRVSPRFDLAKFFPPRNMPSYTFEVPQENIVAKMFVISESAISTLRRRYASSSVFPTRVETVSTFILSKYASATQEKTRNYEVTQMVNLCNRIHPPISEPYLGNLYGYATVKIAMEEGTMEEARNVLVKMRDAVRKVDGDFVGKFQQELHLSKFNGEKAEQESTSRTRGGDDVVQFSFSSLANFPIYEADFGWGKPVWFSSGKDPMDNKVTFHPTTSGQGIEAIFKLKKDDMAKLESDKEFSAFISANSCAKFKTSSSL